MQALYGTGICTPGPYDNRMSEDAENTPRVYLPTRFSGQSLICPNDACPDASHDEDDPEVIVGRVCWNYELVETFAASYLDPAEYEIAAGEGECPVCGAEGRDITADDRSSLDLLDAA